MGVGLGMLQILLISELENTWAFKIVLLENAGVVVNGLFGCRNFVECKYT
jgi:isoprenylcysteine carboxyl methyltransferase (ICMT) family protein YpbQ